MVTTTFAAVALSALLSPTAEAVAPKWQSDYRAAMTAAAAQQKPVAVFVGQGDAGYTKLISDGQIPADAGKALSNGFVCLYVDTNTPEGKTLAGQLAMNSGLVISSKGGEKQALRHTGTVTSDQLSGYVAKYSDPNRAVLSTDYAGVVAAPSGIVQAGGVVQTGGVIQAGYQAPAVGQAFYPGTVIGGCPGGNCGAVYGYGGYPVSGGCPNGRCPLR